MAKLTTFHGNKRSDFHATLDMNIDELFELKWIIEYYRHKLNQGELIGETEDLEKLEQAFRNMNSQFE